MRVYYWVLGAAIFGACAIMGVVVGVVWAFGGLRTDGEYFDWSALAAVATFVAALAAVGALVAVAYGAEQLRSARRTERLSLMPYLRFDVGFVEPSAQRPGFSPPNVAHVFTTNDFGPSAEMGDLSKIEPTTGERGVTVALWVTNQQTAALGGAYRIRVGLVVSWSDKGVSEVNEVQVRFAYVEPGKTTAIRLAKVRSNVTELIVSVFAVEYYGMFLDRELRNRHGALSLYYDSKGGTVQNDRSFGLGEHP